MLCLRSIRGRALFGIEAKTRRRRMYNLYNNHHLGTTKVEHVKILNRNLCKVYTSYFYLRSTNTNINNS